MLFRDGKKKSHTNIMNPIYYSPRSESNNFVYKIPIAFVFELFEYLNKIKLQYYKIFFFPDTRCYKTNIGLSTSLDNKPLVLVLGTSFFISHVCTSAGQTINTCCLLRNYYRGRKAIATEM